MVIHSILVHAFYLFALISAPIAVWLSIKFNLRKGAMLLTVISLSLITIATLFISMLWATFALSIEPNADIDPNVAGDMVDGVAHGVVSIIFLLILFLIFILVFSAGTLCSISILVIYWFARISRSVKAASRLVHRALNLITLLSSTITLIPLLFIQDFSASPYLLVGWILTSQSIELLGKSVDRWERERDYLAVLISQIVGYFGLFLGVIVLTSFLLISSLYFPSYRVYLFTVGALLGWLIQAFIYPLLSTLLFDLSSRLWNNLKSREITQHAYKALAKHLHDQERSPLSLEIEEG